MLSKLIRFLKKLFNRKQKESAQEKEMRALREKYSTGYKVLNINQWRGKYNDIY